MNKHPAKHFTYACALLDLIKTGGRIRSLITSRDEIDEEFYLEIHCEKRERPSFLSHAHNGQ